MCGVLFSAAMKEGHPVFWTAPLGTIRLRIEVDTVGDFDRHIAVGDAVVLGHAHADAVASLVDHRFEVTGGGMPNLKKPKQGQTPHVTLSTTIQKSLAQFTSISYNEARDSRSK